MTRTAQRSQLRDAAVSYIKELIASGRAPAGSHLSLEEIAETIDTSVTPVREALLLLAQDGIVIQERNRGFRVATIRRQDLVDTYFIYSWGAGELVSRAASHIDDATVERLRRLEAEMAALDDNEHQRIEDLHFDLHEVIFEFADSPRLEWFLTASARYVPRHFWATVPGWLEWNRTAHAPIILALERRDPEAARIAMREHVMTAGSLFIASFDAREGAEATA
ncbi:MAG TPA: GntR family transcriptional regulator [Thermoleophilaceae bacterium]|nr:GntR family transcriptional regulator [Thermoleophilaceae bacterium]